MVVVSEVVDPATRDQDDIGFAMKHNVRARVSITDMKLNVDARPRVGRRHGRE
jgi:hypothetical protein